MADRFTVASAGQWVTLVRAAGYCPALFPRAPSLPTGLRPGALEGTLEGGGGGEKARIRQVHA